MTDDKLIQITADQFARLTEQMARFACAAYYRGVWNKIAHGEDLELIVKSATDRLWGRWMDAAQAQLSMAYVLTDKEQS